LRACAVERGMIGLEELGIKEFLLRHSMSVLGALVGLFVGILLITIGLWKTLLLLALMTAGWFLGGRFGGRWANQVKLLIQRIARGSNEE